MTGEGTVRPERALCIAGIADAEDGEIHTLRRQPLPVHAGLIVGHVHAHADSAGHTGVAEGSVLLAGEILGGEGIHRQAFVGRQPHHVGPVVDIDLPRVGIRLLDGAGLAGQQTQHHGNGDGQRRQQYHQRQQPSAPSPAAPAAGAYSGSFHCFTCFLVGTHGCQRRCGSPACQVYIIFLRRFSASSSSRGSCRTAPECQRRCPDG